jgi:hypothetical protein
VAAAQKSTCPVDGIHVSVFGFRLRKHAPVKLALEVLQTVERMPGWCRDLFNPRIPLGTAIPGIVEYLQLKLVPLGRRVESGYVMENLPHAGDVIAVILKLAGERDGLWKSRPPVLLVVIDARR